MIRFEIKFIVDLMFDIVENEDTEQMRLTCKEK